MFKQVVLIACLAITSTYSAPAPNPSPKAKPTVILAETVLPYGGVVAVEPYVYESVPVVHESYVLPSIYADDFYYHYPHVDIVV